MLTVMPFPFLWVRSRPAASDLVLTLLLAPGDGGREPRFKKRRVLLSYLDK